MSLVDWKNKKVAILGFGTEGIAVAQYFSSIGLNNFVILDQSNEEKILERLTGEEKETAAKFLQDEKIEKRLGEKYLEGLEKFNIIVRSPGISVLNEKLQKAKEAGVEITSQIKLFFEYCPCKIIGVTGTKGKGTTSSLISEILKKKFQNPNDKLQKNVFLAGNIGYPAITLLPQIKASDVVILELSSFQLMDLHMSPHIAVVTNLTIDHLDYHKDVTEYQDAKKAILQYQSASDYSVLNCDSTFESKFINSLKSNVCFFSASLPNVEAIVKEDCVILDPMGRNIEICKEEEIKIFGKHNLENIAAATLTADLLGVDEKNIKEVVKKFQGLPHRLEMVAEISGVRYINDSFATNPEPTMAAIASFREDKVLILGGSSKGADFSELCEKIVESNVKSVVLIGLEGTKIKKCLESVQYKGEIFGVFTDLKDALVKIKQNAKKGEVVVFSPSCASFDMFKNYKDRGNKFKEAVLNLGAKHE